MPRKQRQKQSQKQTVVVNIKQEAPRKKSSKRRRKAYPKEGVSSLQQALPPQVIYQSTYSIPYPVQGPPPIQAPVKERTFLQDVGQVGTEGPVQILDRPTKKEQQSEMTTPVPSNVAGLRDTEEFKKAVSQYWVSKQADYSNMPLSSMPRPPPTPPPMRKVDDLSTLVTKVNRKEDLFRQQLEAPTIQSNMEQLNVKGLPDYAVEKLPIGEEAKAVDREALTAPSRYERLYELPEEKKRRGRKPREEQMTPNVMDFGIGPQAEAVARRQRAPRPPLTDNPHRGGTMLYWAYEYKKLTGNDYVMKKGEKMKDLKATVERLKSEERS